MATLTPQGKQAYFDANGDPLAGGKLYTYVVGTSTPLATYSDRAGTVPNANPVVLDARGEATVFWSATGYKAVLCDSADVVIWTQDDIYPIDPALLAPLASPAFTGTPTGLGPATFIATGGTTARSLAARAADVVNVKDFGATGDGVTDDTAAFNAAITAANGTREVFIPGPATYMVKAVAVNVASTSLRGGPGATLKLPQLVALDGSPILTVSVNGVAVRELTLDGNKSVQPADGFSDSWNGGAGGLGRSYRALVRATGPLTGLVVEDCTLKNAYGAGIATLDVSEVKARRNRGVSNNFETVFLYSTLAWPTFIAGHEVTSNYITSTGSGHASVNGNAIVLNHASNSVVSHNVVDTVERNGVKLETGRNVAIVGNAIQTNSIADFGGIQVQGRAADVLIQGNVIRNTGAGVTLNATGATTAWQNISVVGNTIDALLGPTTGDAISASSGLHTGLTIAGNTIVAPSRHAIYIISGGSGLAVTGNLYQLTTGTANNGGLVLVASTSGWQGVTVTGNSFDLGDPASVSSGALSLSRAAAYTITNLAVVGNVLRTGAGKACVSDGGVDFVSGVYSHNMAEGVVEFTSAGVNVSIPGTSTITYGASMTPDATVARRFEIDATGGGGHTINAPLHPVRGHRITIRIKNTSGGALGTATWDAVFKMAAWTQPANGNSRSIDFEYDGTNWIEVSRTAADVPN